MTPEQKLNLLLTGLVLVIAVLIFLTYRMKGYGNAIHKLQSGREENAAGAHPPLPASAGRPLGAAVERGIPEEVVAAITAAVYLTYGDTAGAVTGIRRSAVQPARSAWSMAGLLENTRPF